MKRTDNRKFAEARKIEVVLDYLKYAEGSCLISAGNTKILCAASFDRHVPPFLLGSGQGWLTAEYSLLPRSTHERTVRESTTGKLQGRNQEIRRFLGRSLRSVLNFVALGENQIIIDCDVIQADGGTRTLAVNGGFVALSRCVRRLLDKKIILKNPIIENVGAISVGIVDHSIMLDLAYDEDRNASADMNVVVTESGRLVEVQATAERLPFTEQEFAKMLDLAKSEIKKIVKLQKEILSAI